MKQQFSLFRAADNKVCRRKANSRTPMIECQSSYVSHTMGWKASSPIVVGPQATDQSETGWWKNLVKQPPVWPFRGIVRILLFNCIRILEFESV